MFNSIPRCHDAESESDFYRLHINFCVLRSRKKKKKKIFLWQLWVIYCLSIVVVVVGIRAANRPVPPTSLPPRSLSLLDETNVRVAVAQMPRIR